MPAKLINIVGQTYGLLLVIDRAEDYVSPGGHKSTQWLCQCACGNLCVVRKTHLQDGTTISCGCEARRLTSLRSMVDLTNKRFGMLIAKERIPYISGSGKSESKWLCLCDCGNTTYVRTADLTSGQTRSCGCLRKTAVSKAQFEDLSGQEFGWLTCIKRVQDYVTAGGNPYTQWLCKCRCGKYRIAISSRLKKGYIQSCGCKQMSSGETAIDEMLFQRHIDYKYSFIFPDLIGPGSGNLIFDFALFSNNKLVGLIEFQGIQHYKDIDFGRQQREITDQMKKNYCYKNNISLYEIRYDENIEEKLNEILKEAIYANTVPST